MKRSGLPKRKSAVGAKVAVRAGDEDGPPCPRCGIPNRPARSFCRGCHAALILPEAAPTARQPSRRTPMAVRSAKRENEAEVRAEVVAFVRKRDRVCRAGALVALAQVPHGGALHVHELISRAQWAAGYLEPDNCLLVCAAHHRHIHDHPHAAHALGLLKWSWERPA